MITQDYVDIIIAKAQNAIGDYTYRAAIAIKNGEDPDNLWYKIYVCVHGAKNLDANNHLTDLEKQVIIDRLLTEGGIGKYSAVPFIFVPVVVTQQQELYLPQGKIWIGNFQNIATPRTMSGDATIDEFGVITVTASSGIGPGTANYLSKFITTTTIGDSGVFENGSGSIGIGATTLTARLHVVASTISAGYYETSSTTTTHEGLLVARKGNTNSTDRVFVITKGRTSGSSSIGIASGFYWGLENDTQDIVDSGAIKSVATAVGVGAEAAEMQFFYQVAGALVEGMTLTTTGVLQMDGAAAGLFIQTTGNNNSINITNSGTAGITGVLSTVYSVNANASAIIGVRQNDNNTEIQAGLTLNHIGLLNPNIGADGIGVSIRFDADSSNNNRTMGSMGMRWKVANDASRTSEFAWFTINNAGAAIENLKLDGVGRLFIKTPSSSPTDADIDNGTITAYLNEVGNLLTFRVKYAAGTTKTGTVALV